MHRIAAVVTLIVLGACGDSSGTTTTTEIADPFGPPLGVEVTARDFAFEPASWTVPSSALLVVDFANEGSLEHLFVIVGDQATVRSAAELDESMVFHELRAGAGQSASDSFLAPSAPGVYQVICSVPGHLEAGMSAELIVEP